MVSVVWRLIEVDVSNNLVRPLLNNTEILVREGLPLIIPLEDLLAGKDTSATQKANTSFYKSTSVQSNITSNIIPQFTFTDNTVCSNVVSSTEQVSSIEGIPLLQPCYIDMTLMESYVGPVFENFCDMTRIRTDVNNVGEKTEQNLSDTFSSPSVEILDEIFNDANIENYEIKVLFYIYLNYLLKHLKLIIFFRMQNLNQLIQM